MSKQLFFFLVWNFHVSYESLLYIKTVTFILEKFSCIFKNLFASSFSKVKSGGMLRLVRLRTISLSLLADSNAVICCDLG